MLRPYSPHLPCACTLRFAGDVVPDWKTKQLFAPTDDAFEAAGFTEASVQSLAKPVLSNLLLFHLLEGAANAEVIGEAEAFYTQLKVMQSAVRSTCSAARTCCV